MREVIPGALWVGNAHDARNIRDILDAGLQVVIDLALEEPPVQLPRDLVYCRFPPVVSVELRPLLAAMRSQVRNFAVLPKKSVITAISSDISY